VGWGFGEDGDGKTADADRVEDYGWVVQVAEIVDAEGVDCAMGDEKGNVDADGFAGGWGVAGNDGGGCWD